MSGDATALAAAIRAGRLSAADAMRAALAAARQEAGLGAIRSLDAAMAQAGAARLDALPPGDPGRAAPFAGVPVLAKDLGGPFEGLAVRAGSRALPPGTGDSDLARRFRAAGLLPFGLTTSPEFGLSYDSAPVMGPVCRNPLDRARGAGGSSGGAAAAVAAGIVAIAHATDAGGSIRVPAAACGLVGLKPGRGSIPGGPGFGNHLAGIASELAVCRSVRDCATIFAATRGRARGPFADPAFLPVPEGRLRIAVLAETGPDWPTDPIRAAGIEETARCLAGAGHRVTPLDRAAIEGPARAANRIFAGLIAANLAHLAQLPDFDEALAEPLTRAVLARGRALSGGDLWGLLSDMVLVSRDLWALFDQADLLLVPMLTTAPAPLGAFPTDHGDVDLHFHRMAAHAPLAALANIAGFPAITLPFGRDAEGLPLPVQLIAPLGGEPLLLSTAAGLEAEGRWSHPFPVAGLT